MDEMTITIAFAVLKSLKNNINQNILELNKLAGILRGAYSDKTNEEFETMLLEKSYLVKNINADKETYNVLYNSLSDQDKASFDLYMELELGGNE